MFDVSKPIQDNPTGCTCNSSLNFNLDAPKFVAPLDGEGNAKVFGVAEKELKLECSFKGNPAPTVTWEDALTSKVC